MKEILNFEKTLGVNLTRTAAYAYQYKSWDDLYCREKIVEEHKRMIALYEIDPNDFTADQLTSIGFGRWSHESALYLAPLWILPFLKTGLSLTSIDGEKKIVGNGKIDNDTRFGCIAYGIEKEAA